MDILKQTKQTLIFIIIVALLPSCQRKGDCDEDGGTYSFTLIYDKKSNYVPIKGNLYFFDKHEKDKEYFKALDLLVVKKDKNKQDIYFKDPPNIYKAKYNYRIVLDDSLIYDITNMQMKIDTAGRTMGGWAIGCKLISFYVNERKYEAVDGALEFPFNSARKIK